MTRPPGPRETAEQVARACRILARAGLARASLGHVSVRGEHGRVVVRCRGPQDTGLLFTPAAAVRAVDPDDPGATLRDEGHAPPHELPIHTEIYRARTDVHAVVHVHAPAAVLAGLAGLPLRPVFGAYDMPAARLALAGVPVFDRAALVTRRELGADLAAALGDADVCLMRGHGITTVGSSVPAAVARALELEALAQVTVDLARLGAQPPELSDRDRAELPDLGPAFDDELVWRHHQQLDEHARH